MRDIAQWVFEVEPGESVSIRVVPRESEARYVGVWLDDSRLEADPNPYSYPYLIYTFNIKRPAWQSHVIKLECNFSLNAAPTASYDLWLTGSLGGRESLRTVRRDDLRDIDILFTIAKPSEPVTSAAESKVEGRAREPEETEKTGNGGPRVGVRPTEEPRAGSETGSGLSNRKNWKRGKPPLRSYGPGGPAGGEEAELANTTERPPAELTAKSTAAVKQETVVNVGFSDESTPAIPVKTNRPLACGRLSYFWLDVGAPDKASLEAARPTRLPGDIPAGARLKVALFGFRGELELKKREDVGELELQADGSAKVTRAASKPKNLPPGSSLMEDRLFFAVVTPRRGGTYRLRCNIYYQQVLIQSRLVTARVMARPRLQPRSLRSAVDYMLSKSMSAAHLQGMERAVLSIMLNSNGDCTFGLRIFGETLKDDASFDDLELQSLIDDARGELRMVAWGNREPWQQAKQYRYDDGRDFDRLRIDLIRLAKAGYVFYRKIVGRFTGGVKQTMALSALMQKPGPVQVALKESARHTLPVAMVYDYKLDVGFLKDDQYKICGEFAQNFDRNKPLGESLCFKGDCPSRGDDTTVCPSGFWGYRHYVGMPLSIAGAPDAPTQVRWEGAPHLMIAVSTSPKLLLRADHEKAVRALKPEFKWDYADTRDATFKLMKESNPHLVYFYCHGGLARNMPYLKVGPDDGPVIAESNLGEKEIEWDVPRPLVFINGCHTTALEPEQAIEFVSSFIRDARAAGVIGTEITIFESLARAFAEDCLRRFIVDGANIGESIRGARLALLEAGNPLGLVYVPYVMTGLQLVGQ